MFTKVSVKFRIPKYAYWFLDKMNEQNSEVEFKVGVEDRSITLTCNMLDFSEVSDDWDYEEIEKYIKEVE